MIITNLIQRFHSRCQRLCKFIGTNKACTKEKSPTPTGLVWNTIMAAIIYCLGTKIW